MQTCNYTRSCWYTWIYRCTSIKYINSIWVITIIINEGYYFDALVQNQSYITLNDSGYDPDGIDIFNGSTSINPGIPAASCVVTSLHY
jgi:hypothetical protein